MRYQARSQAQVYVCLPEGECYLLNASPDLRTQILSAPLLNPAQPPRHTPITGVLLTSADVDSVVHQPPRQAGADRGVRGPDIELAAVGGGDASRHEAGFQLFGEVGSPPELA